MACGLCVWVCVCVCARVRLQVYIVVLHLNILENKSAVFTFCLPSVFPLETALFVTVYCEFLLQESVTMMSFCLK